MAYRITETNAVSRQTIKGGFDTITEALAYVGTVYGLIDSELDSDNNAADCFTKTGRVFAIDPEPEA